MKFYEDATDSHNVQSGNIVQVTCKSDEKRTESMTAKGEGVNVNWWKSFK